MLSPLVQVLVFVVGGVAAMLAIGLAVCVPWRWLRSIPSIARLRSIVPHLAALTVALALNKLVGPVLEWASWNVGYNATGRIYETERELVALFQSQLSADLLLYFSFVYVIGYAFLLVFPMVAYFALPSVRPLKELLLAYAINYTVGVVCYTLVIAYGPRNVMPDAVTQPLFELFPLAMLLTSSVNTNTNVFPSLHTSLSVTVLLFAWLTRDHLPRWLPIAAVLSVSVVLSTMALGIHWLTDVLAGILLATGSVYAARRYVSDPRTPLRGIRAQLKPNAK